MSKLMWLALAGAGGTLCRYWLGGWFYQWFGAGFPYGTLGVNLLGCFVMGLLGTLADERFLLNSQFRFILLLGFLGAFTTYSSFAYETWNLFREGETFRATLNAALTWAGCFVGVVLGVWTARLF